MVRLDVEGRMVYASPNARSALHRLGWVGDMVDHSLIEIVTPLLDSSGQVDESLPLVLSGRAPWRSEIEAHGSTLTLRAMPLRADGNRTGALVLLRDVSELRRRERELLTKDATIREVHHRVKNNLQTVAALLRLQARRIPSRGGPGGARRRRCAGWPRSRWCTRRCPQGLGSRVDFDAVVERTVCPGGRAGLAGGPVAVHREGSFGELAGRERDPTGPGAHRAGDQRGRARAARRPGRGRPAHHRPPERDGRELRAQVRDDGVGLPDGFVPGQAGLGTQIVQALVGGEMRGKISWTQPPEGGTVVEVDVMVKELKPRLSANGSELP